MENSEAQGTKRKRAQPDAATVHSGHPPAPPNNLTQINYLLKATSSKINLIEGNPKTFSEVLNLIDEYTGVLQRQESLAASLGAKLIGPLLLKSFEKLFEGPIKVLETSNSQENASVTWLDVVEYARHNPNGFALTDSRNEARVCQFWLKQSKVEISEDDYRLIISGGPERMIPTQALPEDELAELGTIEILEQRLSLLIKKADLVAGRARQLNYHLKGRRTALQGRRAGLLQVEPGINHSQGTDTRQSANLFQSSNSSHPQTANGDSFGIHQDLLRQFVTDDRRSTSPRVKLSKLNSSAPEVTVSGNSSSAHCHGKALAGTQAVLDNGTVGQYRPFMAAKVEKMARGEGIWPPCDRCRRLRMDCTKHLTACSGCTKKHAKCTWKDITQDEIICLSPIDTSMTESGALQVGLSPDASLDPGNDDDGIFARGHGKIRETGGTPVDHGVLGHILSPAATTGIS